MSDAPETVLVGSKVQELQTLADETPKLDVAIVFESPSGEQDTLRFVSHGKNQWVGGEHGARRFYKKNVADVIAEIATPIRGFKLTLVSVSTKATKCALASKELKRLVVDAWCEAIGIDSPSDADIKKTESKKRSVGQDAKETLLADLRGGAAGVENWKHHGAERQLVKHLRNSDLQDAVLTDAKLHKMPDFRGSNFSGAKMERVDLSQVDVRDCNFTNANLSESTLRYSVAQSANFTGARLQGAILLWTMLCHAQLDGCDLTGADLTHADLCGAKLAGSLMKNVKLFETKYDEATTWPADFVPPESGLLFAGQGKDPFLKARVEALSSDGKIDFDTFIAKLEKEFDRERLKKALAMLKAERFQLFAEVKPESLMGVVKSQTNADLVYSCLLSESGHFSCCTQNLNVCGGLRGALCKHLLVLLIGLTKAAELNAATACEWVLASRSRQPKMDKDLASATFLRYKGAEAGEIDWRPTETLPEDYYSF